MVCVGAGGGYINCGKEARQKERKLDRKTERKKATNKEMRKEKKIRCKWGKRTKVLNSTVRIKNKI